MSKEQLIKKFQALEVKADHYSRTDWDSYMRVKEELHELDMKLLDMYNDENEVFLQSISKNLLDSMGDPI